MKSNKLIDKIDHLNKVVLDSMEAKSEYDIVKKFINTAIGLFGADFGFCFMKNKNSFELLYKTTTAPYVPAQPRKDGIVSTAYKTKAPQMITEINERRDIRNDAKQHMASVAVLPLTFKNHNYGTLHICFKTSHHFNDEERVLCSYIGNSAAQTIALKRLYKNLEDLVVKRTTQLKKSNEELERDKVEDEALLSSMGEGVVATDINGRVILFNPRAEEIFGLKKEKILGQVFSDVQQLYEENGKIIKSEDRPISQVLKNNAKLRTKSYYIVGKNGKKIPVSITITPIKLKNQVIGAIEVIHDITKEKELDKAKSELISLASHQLRTPLSAINWYAEALIKKELGPLNPGQKKYLQEIFNANQKMIELVYDFLNVSRIELGTFVIQLSAFNPEEVTQGVLRELQPMIGRKKLKISQDYGPGIGDIQADKKIIRLIMQNLLSNAVKYTPNRGNIWLKMYLTKRSKPRLAIEVADSGYGIPKGQHDRVFTKLFRGDNISQMNTEGTGLGLYIVKSFVDLCKGKIQFRSSVNKGTRFYIELPVLMADKKLERPAAINLFLGKK